MDWNDAAGMENLTGKLAAMADKLKQEKDRIEMLKCENKGCDEYPSMGTTKMFGGVSVSLCNPCVRTWQLHPKVNDLCDAHHMLEVDLRLISEQARGGHLSLDEAAMFGRNAVRDGHKITAEARAFAIEWFGLAVQAPKPPA